MTARSWRVFVCAATAVAVAYAAVPAGAWSDVVYDLFGVAVVGAALAGASRVTGPLRRPWLLAAAGQAVFVAGDLATSVWERILGRDAFGSAVDLVYFAGYPVLALGAVLLGRRRSDRADDDAAVDAAIVTAAIAVLAWVFVAEPALRDASLTPWGTVVSVVYPALDTLVVVAAVLLLFTRGEKPTPLRLLLGSALLLLAGDAVWQAHGVVAEALVGKPDEIVWLLAYALFAAAALHPDAGRLAAHADTRRAPGLRRMLLLAAASVTAPVVLTVRALTDTDLELPAVVGGSVALSLLVLVRASRTVRRYGRAVEREARLRELGAALVAATDRGAIYSAAGDVIHRLVPDGRIALLVGTQARLDVVAAVGERSADVLGRVVTEVPDLPVAAASIDIAADDLLRAGFAAGGVVTVFPLVVGDELRGAVAVRTDVPLERVLREALETISSQVALALEGAALTDDLVVRRSEERFRTLVQNASD